MPQANEPHTIPGGAASSQCTDPITQFGIFAARLAEANACAAALMDGVRGAATYLNKHHGYSLTNLARCSGLHKNSLMKLKDPSWVPEPTTLQKLHLLIVRADAKRRGETFPDEAIRRGRPSTAVRRSGGRTETPVR